MSPTQFLDALARSGLLDAPDLRVADAEAASAGDAPQLARRLVRRGLLTPFQARKLLDGVTRGFFIGGYRLSEPLGRGASGRVFRALGPGGREVALKVLTPAVIAADPQAKVRFGREREAGKRVRHPRIVDLLHAGTEGDAEFLALEFVPGTTVYDSIKGERGGPWSVVQTARLMSQVAEGLGALHAQGIIHRDLKPANIMVTPEREAKLLDLGLALIPGEAASSSPPGGVVGTPDYISPEQVRDPASADARSDLYSLGCCLYFVLAGRPPFDGGTTLNKIYRQRLEEPEPIERLTDQVPTLFAEIVRRLMKKDPASRPASAEEIRRDLLPWGDPSLVRRALGKRGP